MPTPTPPKVKSIDQLVSRLAAVDVDASMEPGEDGVIKYYPISAEAAKNDELRTATEANIAATKAMVPQDDGTPMSSRSKRSLQKSQRTPQGKCNNRRMPLRCNGTRPQS